MEGAQKNVSVRLWTLIKMLCQCIISWPYGQHGGGIFPHLQVVEFENSPAIITHTATGERARRERERERADFMGVNCRGKIICKLKHSKKYLSLFIKGGGPG